ncbi:MAG: hypothetical protein ACOCVF_02985 [bacterium]
MMHRSFMINGLKMVFRRNYKILISETDIDSRLSYSENFDQLYHTFVSYKNIIVEEL